MNCTALRCELEAALTEMSRLRLQAANAEISGAREQSGRCEAEAHGKHLQAELAVVEARLTNRGTHVDLLLREKERLWSQLSRARQAADSPKKAGCSRFGVQAKATASHPAS